MTGSHNVKPKGVREAGAEKATEANYLVAHLAIVVMPDCKPLPFEFGQRPAGRLPGKISVGYDRYEKIQAHQRKE